MSPLCMSSPAVSKLAKAYEPGSVEDAWYARWLADRHFTPDPASTKPAYSLVIPPPNVTGVLTLGHVLNNTIQDILARRARLQGHEVLWLPGTDHAGIATQTVVERRLRKEEKKTRHDLGREAFLEKVWEWKSHHGGIIIQQLKKLGCSCDWSRERFTMDEAYARKVQEVFVDLHAKGLIYRGKRMVNWCPVSLTALSDEEVIPKKQKGYLYYFKVEVAERPGTWLEIATTRPETIMGDTAVAVNPADPRYAGLIGLHIRRPLPLDQPALLPIVGDEAVDFSFGTGVLKVTPAHDKADYEIGLRHGLPVIDILNPDGTLNELAGGDFAGLDRFEARAQAIERLRELGLLVKEEPYENNVGFSERADVPIEPRLSEQWFLRYPQTNAARDAVRNGLIRFFPARWEKVYDHWLENIQDWCISRQLWWGHRIPVWYDRNDRSRILCQIDSPGPDWEQDTDVLDTWFSSWLWAHETMDEPTRSKFYPTSVLVTGPDIIFFWVARMIMAGLEYTGQIPFREVFFTGIIRDRQGRKMSKSLGNSPDPLDLIDRLGADGLRFGLLRIAPQGQDIRFDENQVAEGRNFCNKLWNACRFREMHGALDPAADPHGHELSPFARALLDRLDQTIRQIDASYAEHRFNEIAQALYDFVWGDFCDRFIEVAKSELFGEDTPRRRGTLATIDYTLHRVLRLLHPFAPFLTEELWHGLGFATDGQTIQFAGWPSPSDWENPTIRQFNEDFHTAASLARNLRATYNLPSNKKLPWIIRPASPEIAAELPVLATLLHAKSITLHEATEPPTGCATTLTPLGHVYLPLAGLLDPLEETKRLEGELRKVEAELAKAAAKLASENFVRNAPREVVEEHRLRQEKWQEKLQNLLDALKALQ